MLPTHYVVDCKGNCCGGSRNNLAGQSDHIAFCLITSSVEQTRDALQPLIITPGKEIQNKFGAYRHSDLVGIPYGSKVGSRTGRGFIHVLRPTPELWTMALPHRTQILYLADISFIVSRLDIKPGSKVIEAGELHNNLIFHFVRIVSAPLY